MSSTNKSFMQKAAILSRGSWHGFDYAIEYFDTHYAIYVHIPRNHPYYGKKADDIGITCSGGLTFSGAYPSTINPKTGWWIGWELDNKKAGNNKKRALSSVLQIFKSYKSFEGSNKWIIEEIEKEIKDVINQLRDAYILKNRRYSVNDR